jgi:hypothetical protein
LTLLELRKSAHILKLFVEFDRSSLELHFDNFSANKAQHSFVCEVIDHWVDLLCLYLEFQRDVVERSKPFRSKPETAINAIKLYHKRCVVSAF